MRVIRVEDVQDTFIDNAAEEAIAAVHQDHGIAIASMLTNIERLRGMGLDEEECVEVSVMVFGAFTAGVLTTQRLIKEGE